MRTTTTTETSGQTKTTTTTTRLAQAIETQRPFAFVAVGLAILYIAGTSMWSSALPPSYWYSVRSVFVADAHVGMSPLMQVDRVVKRPFRASRIVTVARKNAAGTFARFCVARGWHEYQTDDGDPDILDLDWWTAPTKCDLPEGTYKVQTSWYMRPDGGYPKDVHNTSNIFKVLP